jgi:hypothetical protein
VCAIGPSAAADSEELHLFVLDADGAVIASTDLAEFLGTPVERLEASAPIGDGRFAVVTTGAGVITVATLSG